MNDPIIKTFDSERLRRITYKQPDGQVLDICEIKKTGRVVVHTERPGQVPGVVTFGDLDQLWYLLETLYTIGTNEFVPLPESITKAAETAPEAAEMHYADHGVAGGLPHPAEACEGTYWGPRALITTGWPDPWNDPEEVYYEQMAAEKEMRASAYDWIDPYGDT